MRLREVSEVSPSGPGDLLDGEGGESLFRLREIQLGLLSGLWGC